MNERYYLTICRFFSVLSVFSLVGAFIAAIFSGLSLAFSAVVTVAALFLMISGYCIQALTGKIFCFRRLDEDHGYESSVRYFSVPRAIPAISVSIAVGTVVYGIVAENSYSGSLLPLFYGLIYVIPVLTGAVCWFYPNNRLVSIKTILVSGPLSIVLMILCTALGSVSAYVIPAILMFLYALSSLLILNQNNMIKSYLGTVVSYASIKDKGFNMIIVLAVVMIIAVSAFLIYVVLKGIKILVLMFLAVTFFRPSLAQNVIDRGEGGTVVGEINRFLFGTEKASQSYDFYIFLLFILIFIAVLILLAVKIFSKKFDLSAFFKKISDAFIGFFYHLFARFNSPKYKETVFINYVDEEADHVPTSAYDIDIKKRGFPEFMRRFEAINDGRRKLMFSYSVFVSLLDGQVMNIKRSDTPREICQKILSCKKDVAVLIGSCNFDKVTCAFEIAAYNERVSDDSEFSDCAELLASLIGKLMS